MQKVKDGQKSCIKDKSYLQWTPALSSIKALPMAFSISFNRANEACGHNLNTK